MHLDHGDPDGQAVDFALRHDRALAVGHDGYVVAGAAHVHAHDVGRLQRLRQLLRGQHPARGAGQQQLDRRLHGGVEADGPAVGLDQIDGGGNARLRQALAQGGHVTVDHRDQQRVQHGGGGAFEFANLWRHLVAAGDRHVGAPREQRLADDDFMGGIGKGVEEADGRGPDAACRDAVDYGVQRRTVQGAHLLAARADPARRAEAVPAGDQNAAVGTAQGVDVAPGMATDLQHILEPFGGDQRALGQVAGQHGIGGDGRPVQDQADVVQRKAEPRGRQLQGVRQPARRIVGGGGRLEAVGQPRVKVAQLQVSKSAADVDGDGDAVVRHGLTGFRRGVMRQLRRGLQSNQIEYFWRNR